MNNLTENQIRTRFAPSPTGFMHVGNLRTALYAYLVAKKSGGSFVLRIEDTDQKRIVKGTLEEIISALNWSGIEIDEGVCLDKNNTIVEKGELGPYFQSKRLNLYKKYADELVEKGHAYPCFCTSERLKELRESQQKNGQPPMYDKKCLSLSKQEGRSKIEAGEQHVIRLNVPHDKLIELNDQVYGKVSVKGSTIDDQVLMKSDGFPTYHLAVVVDDHLMKISHVIRGEDWLPSTPKHVLLYEYFTWNMPAFVHVPNVLGENRKKFSKRQGDVSVEDFIEKGYLPEALVNFLALLGWNPKSQQEYFILSDLEKIFDVKSLHKAGAVFDFKKLNWMNSHYIKQKTDEELLDLCIPHFEKYFKDSKIKIDREILKKIVHIEKERIKTLFEITDNIEFYFAAPNTDKNMLRWKQMTDEELVASLQKSKKILEAISEKDFVVDILQNKLFTAAGDKKGELLWPLRVALSGKEKSPSPFEIAWAIGKSEALGRISAAFETLKN